MFITFSTSVIPRFRPFLGNHDYAVDVGQDKITRPDLDAFNLDHFPKRFVRPSAGDVAWRLEPGKYRETQPSDKRIVSAPAIDNITPHAAEMEGLCRKLAHESETVIMWLANNYVPCRRRVQEFCPSNHTFMDIARWIGSPLHREYTPRYSSFRIKRANCMRQDAVFHPEVAHHVVNGHRSCRSEAARARGRITEFLVVLFEASLKI